MTSLRDDELRDALDAAFPASWRGILRDRVAFYRTLTETEQERFEDRLQELVVTKKFTGARGLAVTDEMRVVAAAAACRLTLNLSWHGYTHVSHVTLHPEESWRHTDSRVVGLGNRWKVTLSWPTLLRDMAEPDDGHNVGYHEFAHAIDGADGSMDGEALGPPAPSLATWIEVIASARSEVANAIAAGQSAPIDPYAAKSNAELFAVATEWFFERPAELAAALPALYGLLRDFYRQDPRAR
ncbi:MAG TPA: zinc-dependent peptidase [Kofleriaceae bacterium]